MNTLSFLARISEQEMTETNEWTKFDLDFKSQNGKTINTEDLKMENTNLQLYSPPVSWGRISKEP